MKAPKRTDDKYWTGTRNFNHIQYESDLEDYIIELENDLIVTNKLLTERQRVLDAIPECEIHGSCVPHAIEWIEKMKSKL